MYASFYKLKKEPFHITPDPEFLFLSPSHKEALGSIVYGVGHRKGFVLITGEVGVGKTTILRSYLEEIDRTKLKILYIFNSNVTFQGLLKTIFTELGIIDLTDDVFEMVNQLHYALIEEYKKGFTVVLIIDEAQNMPVETLENIRLLSNLETSTDKLIQIVFSGQPEFEQKLEQKELRQLKQRIAVKATIRPLTAEESRAYIMHRLTKASAENAALFTDSALRKIIKEAHGIPRLINILCENAFITALGYREGRITSKIVKEVISDFSGTKKKPILKIALAALTLVLAMVSGLLFFNDKDQAISLTGKSTLPIVTNQDNAKTAKEHIGTVPAEQSPAEPPSSSKPTETLPSPDQTELPVVKVVKKGDTLSRLVEEVYGFSNRKLLYYVRENNAAINDVDRIMVGERILFPAREKERGRGHE
jgi:general secretion pathway protein A